MEEKFNRTLLPEFIKKPIFIFWVFILPQLILLFINLRSFWFISDEVAPDKMHIVYSILGAEIGLLSMASFAWLYSRVKKLTVGLLWNAVLLATHIGFLWYLSSHLEQLIPNNIEPWILDQGMLIVYQFTFMMPGLFYAGLRLACFDSKMKGLSDLGFSVIVTILAPVTFYVLFVGCRRYTSLIGSISSAFLASVVFIGTTVMAFVGLIRLVVLTYNYLRSKGDVVQIVFAVIVALIGPIAGLLLNKKFPFPVNFQAPWVYVLAVINGLIVIIPSIKKADGHGYLLFARSVTYPFTFYFFLVFLPFLPLSLPAMFAIGAGFLILVPVVLFLLHTKRLSDDFKKCHQANGVLFAIVLVVVGMAFLPGYFVYQATQDKVALKSALKYVYSPDYTKNVSFDGSVTSLTRSLINLKQFKQGIQLPYLSGFYNRIVFEGMVLPDKKIEYLYRLFAGEEINKKLIGKAWGFDGLVSGRRRDRNSGVRPIARDRNVALSDFNVESESSEVIVTSRLHLEMKSMSDSSVAEFFRELIIPESVLITDFHLKVNDAMVASTSFIIVERSSQWKMLKTKEQQRLRATEGLEFQEDFNTPAPSELIILILFGIWYIFQNKKSKMNAENKSLNFR